MRFEKTARLLAARSELATGFSKAILKLSVTCCSGECTNVEAAHIQEQTNDLC